MARIKIDLPERFLFTTKIPIRITDINYGGHVGNDTILSIIQEARIQFLENYGYTELNIAGIGLIMSDAGIEFKTELFYGEEIIVSVSLGQFTRVSFDLFYKLEKKSASGKIIPTVIAKTGMVCFNYSTKKIVSVPEEVLKKFRDQ